MSNFPLIAVTDSANCPRPLTLQIERLANDSARPDAILLRAKDLCSAEYHVLALQMQKICTKHKLPLILHSDWQLTHELNIDKLHLPLPLLRTLPQAERKSFTWLSTSVHSISEAQEAVSLGANILIAGHIYTTQCKAELAPRGLNFLHDICAAVTLPVYAIGGISFSKTQHKELAANGAHGACVMSAYMKL